MSETAAALFILPVLAGLVLVLECSRLGCTHLFRRMQRARVPQGKAVVQDRRHASAL